MLPVHRHFTHLVTACVICIGMGMGIGLPGSAAHAESSTDRSLYERLGGSATVTAIVNDLVERSASDPRTRRSWHKVTLSRVKSVLGEFLCSLAGGPCAYNGDSMQQIHAGLNINEAEMFAMVESLREIMIRHDVPLRERNELLALLAPMKHDVVTR